MKQSSIEWLIEELNKSTSLTSFVPECSDDYKKEILGIIDQAKQLHKQEMIEFATEYDEYCHKSFVQNQYKSIKSAEQYYNETFKSE